MRKSTRVPVVLLAVLLLAGAGCDFFKSSGPEGGVSPFINEMRISRSSTSCDRDFVISFRYQDPQDDIDFMRVTFQHEGGFTQVLEVLFETNGGLVPEEEPLDPELTEDIFGGTLDLTVEGRAAYTYHFQCGTNRPTGKYLVTVQVVDSNGHESNTRSDTISLTTS